MRVYYSLISSHLIWSLITALVSSTSLSLKDSVGPLAVSFVCLHVCFLLCSICFMFFQVFSLSFVFNCQTLYIFVSVCQEVVWEAFKIFLDRLPVDEEYQHWLSQCQTGTISAREIGIAMSQSVEHLALFYSVSKNEPPNYVVAMKHVSIHSM